MAKSGTFLHFGSIVAPVAAIGTAYDLAKLITVKMNTPKNIDGNPTRHKGFMESIRFAISSAAGVSTVTWKLCSDAACDNIVLQSTPINVEAGETTATVKSGSGTIDIPLQNNNSARADYDTYYLLMKGDAATFTVDSVEFGWSE